MKIKAIGTGAIWSKKNSACYLIDETILIDIPNGTCKELKRIGVEPIDIKYILLTHLHGDHYFDIPFLLLSKIKSEYICSVVIATSKDGISKIKKLTKLAFPNTIKKIKNKVKIKYETSQNFNRCTKRYLQGIKKDRSRTYRYKIYFTYTFTRRSLL